MKTIPIKIPGKEYNVHLGNDIFPKLPKLLVEENIVGDILIVLDRNVKKYYFELIKHTFGNIGHVVKYVSIHSSEKNKSFETLQKIHSSLIKNNFGRDSVIIAIGGGIIGDITGFAASTFMRGIKYVQVPTTLLSSVDSSVGGKTGINFDKTKNVIGSFYQPELVLIDTRFFSTLPEEEMLCGIGEIIKYSFLTNNKFFDLVKNNIKNIFKNNSRIIQKIIAESIIFKGRVVEEDEREAGIRKVLNLGHTFAHAFEVQQKHKLKHGQAVIVGITCAIYLSKNLGLIENKQFQKFLDLLLLFNQKIKLKNIDLQVIFKIMQRDKKNRNNEINFVLIKNIGEIVTEVTAPITSINDSMRKTFSHF